MVDAIKYVDHTYIFSSTSDLEQLIKFLNPDIMVIGSDWKGKTVIGKQYAKRLEFFDRIKRYSTTEILRWTNNRK
jgi:bifunctional ADP-heptose synthase (sugar kinase/adenylyltransferase)